MKRNYFVMTSMLVLILILALVLWTCSREPQVRQCPSAYQNYLALCEMVRSGTLDQFGYAGRPLDQETRDSLKTKLRWDKNEHTIQTEELNFAMTVLDWTLEGDHDAGRLLIEFQWETGPKSHRQAISFVCNSFRFEDVYTLLKYENPKDPTDCIYEMCVAADQQGTYFNTEPFPVKQGQYVLRSGAVVLDLISDVAQPGKLLYASVQYKSVSLFNREKILAEQKIEGLHICKSNELEKES